jgi:23S rRNA pseudouridine2605 synthase
MKERLQKLLAQAGLGSRRACEKYITAGRVTVNGLVASLGQQADPEKDQILIDGRPLPTAEKLVYIMIYKPRNILSTVKSPDARTTVRKLIPIKGTLYPVGRLDVDSEGLLLLTNDGHLTNWITHPRYEHEKEYLVLISRPPDEQELGSWRQGVVLTDGFSTKPARVTIHKKHGKGVWLKVVMDEGHKRQIREICRVLGLTVVRLIRTRIASLFLGDLGPGEWRYLTSQEIANLKG